MITPAYAAVMARYNTWQNRSLFGAAETLGEAARAVDRGAFFGSIHGTLSHLLWADAMWLSRFTDWARPDCSLPDSGRMVPDWAELRTRRIATDAAIEGWARALAPGWLAGEVTWFSGATRRSMTRPAALLVAHMFNHQTHHRGQVHAMLTAAGAKPDDTDLMLLAAS